MPKSKGQRSGAQLGIFDIPNLDDIENVSDCDTDDPDLEAELNSLQGGRTQAKSKKKVKKAALPVNPDDLSKMIADSLRDIPSDEDMSDVEDDPDLLAELSNLNEGEEDENEASSEMSDVPIKPARPAPPAPASGNSELVHTLEERLKMYIEAEKSAKQLGETSKVRRCGRGIKTLEKLVKDAKAGRKVSDEDIPPPIAVSGQKPKADPGDSTEDHPNSEPMPAPPDPAGDPPSEQAEPPSEQTEPPAQAEPVAPMDPVRAKDRERIVARQLEYKRAALQSKKDGNKEQALLYIRVVKDLDVALKVFDQGQVLDLSEMPGPPGECIPQVEDTTPLKAADPAPAPPPPAPKADSGSIPTPTTVLGVLEQREVRYKEEEQKAKEDGNTSKARRMGRIVKQFQDAIKSHKAGRSVQLDELPCPPGYPPFPGQAPQELKIPVIDTTGDAGDDSESAPAVVPSRAPGPAPAKPTKNAEQLTELLRRQQEFKQAAVKAKKDGDVEKAKEYLKSYKGFEPLIEASRGGIPVDFSTLPISPFLADDDEGESFEIIGSGVEEGDKDETYDALQKDLVKQIEMCKETSDHFKAVGDIGNSNKFEQLRLNSRKDLRTLLFAKKRDDPVPKFHYELRTYAVVECSADLNDNEFELGIISGINFNVNNPTDIDTYVRYDFPFPSSEDPQKGKTSLVKDTNNPKYNETFKLTIDRGSRTVSRLFKSKSLKLEVWARGYTMGIFRSDSILGTVQIKLQPLEKQCVVHEAFDIMDGRKKVGKLEVKCRLRTPILGSQMTQVKKKWLIIDGV